MARDWMSEYAGRHVSVTAQCLLNKVQLGSVHVKTADGLLHAGFSVSLLFHIAIFSRGLHTVVVKRCL